MKNIFKIYKKDIKNVIKNPIAIVVMLGLIILPSLYAWFNIKSSWDPYSNTKGISVAIVNNDKGTNFNGKNVNIGNDIVKQLKKNNKIGWIFVKEEEAKYGIKHGKYYATIEVPVDFSKKISSLLSDHIQKPELIYTVNEKRNAVAPKITEKGVTSLQQEVTKSFVQVVNKSIFQVFNSIGIELQNKKPLLNEFTETVFKLNSKIPEINQAIDEVESGTITLEEFSKKVKGEIPLINETINKSINIVNTGEEFINKSKSAFSNINEYIVKDLELVKQISDSIDGFLDEAIKFVGRDKTKEREMIISVKDRLNNLSKIINNINNSLKKLNEFKPKDEITLLISKLEELHNSIEIQINLTDKVIEGIDNGNATEDLLNQIKNKKLEFNNRTNKVLTYFNSKVSPKLKNLVDDIFVVMDNSLKLLNDAKKSLPTVNELLGKAEDISIKGQSEIKILKEKLPKAEKIIEELNEKLKTLNNDIKLNDIITLLKKDAGVESEFIASPVNIKQNRIFPIENYGSAMTPFFTTLSLWVGALILVSILSTEVKNFQRKLKSYEEYFGRYLIFMTLGILQALVVTIGDILILRVKPANSCMFVLYGMFISVIFTVIIYTLVSVFGNVGKALGVILLVLQISASGGTFPIEVTPPFFQKLNPLLPFTYAISSMREAVAGVMWDTVWYNTFILISYFVIAILIALLLKSKLGKINKNFVEKFKETGLAGEE
ncbi:YhgE/Pip domain-containing protein [Hathewaya limosa]|uniref:YhgE/Pip-like protein n=1 Tax=Hathewaya limosa TaxID=1536 RepID=A0ABU0JR15_HATLI|nr:YhgE/Pip domain-containing protein [Hathewaya limosa]MDQ0479539.1 YhgE/Pip-like protein [Hathewaya limosa]